MTSVRLLAIVAAFACMIGIGVSAAQAAGACGVGWHRNYYGRCVPN